MSRAFTPSDERDHYKEPLKAPQGCFKIVLVCSILLVAGGIELFLDDINEFHGRLSTEFQGKLSAVIAPEAGHVPPLVDHILGQNKTTKGEDGISPWLPSV